MWFVGGGRYCMFVVVGSDLFGLLEFLDLGLLFGNCSWCEFVVVFGGILWF